MKSYEYSVGPYEMTSTTQALIELPQASDVDIRPMVEAELNKIKVHSLFKDTTRMKRFLEYVVTESLEGREDRLKGYAIGLEVFDRPDDFDPQADTIVRVQAGQLRRRLDIYYSGDGKASPIRILIPKGRYSPVFEVRRDVDNEDVLDAKATVAQIEKQNRPGIAVLTFQNLTPEENTSYFAEGVTAEIINALIQFRYIRIVSRTASMIDTVAPSSDLSDIAEKQNVQFVLTGNVRRAGGLVRVAVNLISAQTGEHIYSKIFDREYTPENLFDIQEEIASYIAASVAAPFGAINRYNRRLNSGRQLSMTAYEAFLKYYEMALSPCPNKARELLEEFEGITKKTPRFSSAWAVKSLLNTFLVTQTLPGDNAEHRLAAAIKAGTRASAIDPENALAFMALFQAYYHSGKFELADKMAEKSIALNPNDYNMLSYYAATLALQGNADLSLSFQSAAMELVARPPLWFYFSSLVTAFQNQKFEEVFLLLNEVNADSHVCVQTLGLACMGHLNKTEEAKAFLEQVRANTPDYDQQVVEVFSYWHPNQEILDLVISGWRKAGLDIPPA